MCDCWLFCMPSGNLVVSQREGENTCASGLLVVFQFTWDISKRTLSFQSFLKPHCRRARVQLKIHLSLTVWSYDAALLFPRADYYVAPHTETCTYAILCHSVSRCWNEMILFIVAIWCERRDPCGLMLILIPCFYPFLCRMSERCKWTRGRVNGRVPYASVL